MEIFSQPFNVSFPVDILNENKIDFLREETRTALFKRNIYYKHGNHVLKYLEGRTEIVLALASAILSDFKDADVLSISLFGSAIYAKNPGDFDFLVILKGNIFDYKVRKIAFAGKEYEVGISIKGIENYGGGKVDEKSKIPFDKQSKIICRTVISLFRRHIPIIGNDFNENDALFHENIYAHVSDLLTNAYELYVLNMRNLDDMQRARKILSRSYEATTYMMESVSKDKISAIRDEIYSSMNSGCNLSESNGIFVRLVQIYNGIMLKS